MFALLASAGAVTGIVVGSAAAVAALVCGLVFGLRDRAERRALEKGRALFGEVKGPYGAVHPSREYFSVETKKRRRTVYAAAFDDGREKLLLFFAEMDDRPAPMVREIPYGDITGCSALLGGVTVSARGLDGKGEEAMRRKARRQMRSLGKGGTGEVRVRVDTADPVVPSFAFPLSGPGLRRRGRRLVAAADILVTAHLVTERYASLPFSERFDPFGEI